MSSPLEHPGWAGVGAWCQASSPDKWPLSTQCRMFHSSRPATLARLKLRIIQKSWSSSIPSNLYDFNLQDFTKTDWYLTDETCFIWSLWRWWCGLTFPLVRLVTMDTEPGPTPGTTGMVTIIWCQESRESVISGHHQSMLCSFAC